MSYKYSSCFPILDTGLQLNTYQISAIIDDNYKLYCVHKVKREEEHRHDEINPSNNCVKKDEEGWKCIKADISCECFLISLAN